MSIYDEILTKLLMEHEDLRNLNAELLAALEKSVNWWGEDPEFHSYVVRLIAKAEAMK